MEVLVSIIVPIFQRKDIIDKAIGSVQMQTYQNWELIIVNDYGTDGIEEYITRTYRDDKRIRCICNNGKKGVSGARNTGIQEAKGEYIAFLDSDDIWEKKHIEELLGAMISEKIDMGFALWYEGTKDNLKRIGDSDEFQNLLHRAEKELCVKKTDRYYIWNEDFYEYTINTYFYCYHINTMIVRKVLLEVVGMFDENLASSEDCDLLFKLLCRNKFILYYDYHYTYYLGGDGIYSFYNRDLLSIQQIIEDNTLVEKFTKLGVDKVEVRKRSYQLVLKSSYVKDKEMCRKIIYQAINKKYVTLAIINQKYNRKKSLEFLLMALRCRFDWRTICMISQLLIYGARKYIYTNINDLDLM